MTTLPEDEPEVDYRDLLARLAFIEKQMAAHHMEISDLRQSVDFISKDTPEKIRKLANLIILLSNRTRDMARRLWPDKSKLN